MDPRLIENFNEITNILKNREEPVDIFLISAKLNISIKQSKILLNSFITQKNLLLEYNVIYSAEIIEENKLKSILVPSSSSKLTEVLNLKDNLLQFSVFAIYKKEQINLLNDYSIFCHENKLVQQVNVDMIFREGELTAQMAGNAVNKNKVGSVNNINTNNNNNINKTKTNSNSSTTNKANLANPSPIVKTGSNSNSSSVLTKLFNNKVISNKEKIIEVQSANQEHDMDLVQDNNISNNDKFGEEIFYGGPLTNLENSNFNKNNDKDILPEAGKRKNDSTKDSKATKIKKESKNNRIRNNNSSVYSSGNESEGETGSTNIKLNGQVKEINQGIITMMSEEANHENINDGNTLTNNATKKIRKTRRVKKTNTYQDEKGYMRTIDEWEDEEYWTDEKQKPVAQTNNNFSNNTDNNNNNGKKPAKKKNNQASLFSFFIK